MTEPKGLTAEKVSNWLEGMRQDLKGNMPELHKAGIQLVREHVFTLERRCVDPLREATIAELYQEIAKRSAAAVIVYSRYPKNNGKEQVTVMNSGPVSSGIGLLDAAKGCLFSQREITMEPTNDEPDEELIA